MLTVGVCSLSLRHGKKDEIWVRFDIRLALSPISVYLFGIGRFLTKRRGHLFFSGFLGGTLFYHLAEDGIPIIQNI